MTGRERGHRKGCGKAGGPSVAGPRYEACSRFQLLRRAVIGEGMARRPAWSGEVAWPPLPPVATIEREELELSASAPEPALHASCTIAAAPPRRATAGEGRLWLSLRTVLVGAQVAGFTLVGWLGATLTLLPLAIRGAPTGRRGRAGAPRMVRLLEDAPPEEVLPR